MTETDIDPIQFSPDEQPELISRVDTADGPYYSESTDVSAPLSPRGVVIGIGIKSEGEETFGGCDFERFRERVERIYEHVIWFGDEEP